MDIDVQEMKKNIETLTELMRRLSRIQSWGMTWGDSESEQTHFSLYADNLEIVNTLFEKNSWDIKRTFAYVAVGGITQFIDNNRELPYVDGWREKVDENINDLNIF